MIEALSLNKLQEKIQKRYEYDEQRVVGIMLARYDIEITKELVKQCYPYWHYNSNNDFDIFWAGYGAYLSPAEGSATKTILKYKGNTNRLYFDLEAFIEIKNQFNNIFKSTNLDQPQLILVNYRDGKLRFNESFKIDLEENLDSNYNKIRKIIEFVTFTCRSEHQVDDVVKKLKNENLKDFIKGITLSDIINVATSLMSK